MEEIEQKPQSPAPAPEKFDLKYANRNLVLFAVLAATVMYIEIMLTPSLPAIAKDYAVTSGQVSLILALYTVFGTAINPIVGKLGDIYGKKKILTLVLIIYSITVTITSFAPNFNVLLFSRTFQGIGLGIFPLAFSLVREQFPRNLVPKAQGLISAMFGAGLAFGLPIGAFIANQYGWQTNYHIATPIVLVLTVLIIYTVRESTFKNPTARMDYVGAATLGVSLGLIVLGLSEGSVWGWTSSLVLGMIIVGVLLLVPLIPYERRIKEPVLNFGQLRIRNVLVANVMAVITGLAMLLAFQAIVYQLEDIAPAGYGFDIFQAGLYLLPLGIVMLLVTYPVGILISKIGVKPFLIAGSIIGSLGFLMMSTATTAIQIPLYLAVASVGLAMLFVAAQNLLVLTVKPIEMGIATSMNTVFRNVGQSLGAPVAGSILSTFTFTMVFQGVGYSLPTRTAFQYSYYIAAIAFVFSLVAALFAREVMGKKVKPEIIAQN